jgi:predicted nucleic acid-binding protein
MWAYCDTSALAARYVREPGRQALARLLARRRVVSSVLLPLELHSAFGRRVREGTLATIDQPRLFARIAEDRPHWTLVELTDEVLREAGTLLEHHPLRSLDAIHVASARIFAIRAGADMIFVSADRRQRLAAAAVGLQVR